MDSLSTYGSEPFQPLWAGWYLSEYKPLRTGVLAGNRITILLDLVPEAKVDDWVLIHAGIAINTIDEELAADALKIIDELDVDANEL